MDFHSFAKIANSFQGRDPVGLHRGSKANNTCRALDHVVNKSKSEEGDEECARRHGQRIVQQKKERSEQGEGTPEPFRKRSIVSFGPR